MVSHRYRYIMMWYHLGTGLFLWLFLSQRYRHTPMVPPYDYWYRTAKLPWRRHNSRWPCQTTMALPKHHPFFQSSIHPSIHQQRLALPSFRGTATKAIGTAKLPWHCQNTIHPFDTLRQLNHLIDWDHSTTQQFDNWTIPPCDKSLPACGITVVLVHSVIVIAVA
jgi:hypothetical protein